MHGGEAVSRLSSRHFVVEGSLQVVGNVGIEDPCVKLAPIFKETLEGGLRDCRYVELSLMRKGSRKSETVFDLWLVSGATGWTDPGDEPVVDFYEPAALKEAGDETRGQHEITAYDLAGQEILILEGPRRRRPRVGAKMPL